jgi:hypothetical protein
VFGVQFFFIISGFVLGHHFAKKYIHNNEKADLKKLLPAQADKNGASVSTGTNYFFYCSCLYSKEI